MRFCRSNGVTRDGAYNNSYIIADPREAWVFETVGKRWIARRFLHGTAAISNQPSIRESWDLAGQGISLTTPFPKAGGRKKNETGLTLPLRIRTSKDPCKSLRFEFSAVANF